MKGCKFWKKALVPSLLGCLAIASAAQAGETFKLAMSLAITGPTSDAGGPYSMGADDYVKYVNDTKMLGDNKVSIDIRDDQYNNDVTKRNFEEFLDEGIVLYLNYSTGSTLALKKDFDEVKIPVLPASLHRGNLDGSNYILLPITSYSAQVIGLAEYVAKNHKGPEKAKVAMFIHPSAFGRGPVEDTQKAVAAGVNIEIVEVVEHGKDLDNTAMIQRLKDKGVQYVITHTVQSPVATLLKAAEGLGVVAKSFGEAGKLTFLGAHYTGGNDLIALAGPAAEGFLWATSYTLTSEPGKGTDFVLDVAKRYGRDEKTANSHNYTAGMMVTQLAVETMRRALAHDKKVTRASLFDELNAMNGANAYSPLTTVGPVTFSPSDREGVDTLQLYRDQGGKFVREGAPFIPEYYSKIK
ncbi:MAG: ABC transporter substrate-binding protein [Proteobacteria bacterium]|nr:ABC transporter substrate-binding protein [Pseudomonadota bacterium]